MLNSLRNVLENFRLDSMERDEWTELAIIINKNNPNTTFWIYKDTQLPLTYQSESLEG